VTVTDRGRPDQATRPAQPTRTAQGIRTPDVVRIAASGGIAVQPIGAVEQHGPHLPVTTDATVAEALAEGAVAKLPESLSAWVLPTLPFGLSPEHAGRPGTVSLSAGTLLALCLDVAKGVAESGIGTLIFVNAHGGNPDLLRVVSREIRAAHGVKAFVVHAPDLPLPDVLRERMPHPELDVHAGFYETSVMLALDPSSVALDEAAPDGLAVLGPLAEQQRISLFGAVSLPWHTDELSASGVIGDPTGADASWGRAALEAQTTVLAETIEELVCFEYPPLAGPGSPS